MSINWKIFLQRNNIISHLFGNLFLASKGIGMFQKRKIAVFLGDFDSLCIDEKEVVDIDHIFVGLDVEACHFAKVKEQKWLIGGLIIDPLQ